MGVDWGLAGQIDGAGFGAVFIILIILGIIIWLVGKILSRIGADRVEASSSKKGD